MIYRKPIHTNHCLDFNSNMTRKESVIKSLVDRAFNLCSPDHLEDELTFIKNTLKSNGYKTWKINKVICKKRNLILTPTSSTLNSHYNSDRKYILAPYINGDSEKN